MHTTLLLTPVSRGGKLPSRGGTNPHNTSQVLQLLKCADDLIYNVICRGKDILLMYIRYRSTALFIGAPLTIHSSWQNLSMHISLGSSVFQPFASSCACVKYNPGLCSPFIHYVVSNDSASGQSPDQTVRMCRLIWAFAVCIYPKTRFRMARPIYLILEFPDYYIFGITKILLVQI